MHLAIMAVDGLWLVLGGGNGEVDRQDGEGVDQELEVVVYLLGHLFLGAVSLAQEAGALAECVLVYLGACADDACRIELHLQLVGELAHLYVLEVAEAVACVFPHLQLSVEEARDAAVLHDVGLALQHLLSGLELHGAQAVFI